MGGLGLLALFQYVIFAGQSFFLHFVTYNLVPFTWNRFGFGVLLFAVIFGVSLLVGLEFLRQNPEKLLTCYLGCALVFTLFSVGKEESGTNYYLEPVLILSPLFAGLIGKRIEEPLRTAELLCLLSVSLLAGTRLASLSPHWEDFARDRAVQDYLRQNFAPGTPASSVFAGDLVRAGLETPISDLYQYTWLACQGTIPEEELVGQFEERRFGVILPGVDLYDEKDAHRPNEICLSEPLHQTILNNYELDATLEMPGPEQGDHPTSLYAWVPRPPSESADPPVRR